jgi:hypothetical protein
MQREIPPMTVSDPYTNATCQLEYLNPYKAHKTLGHYKEPAGLQVAQFTHLKEKSDSITEFLWSTPLTRADAWTYYTACYLPRVCYPLTASYLTEKHPTKSDDDHHSPMWIQPKHTSLRHLWSSTIRWRFIPKSRSRTRSTSSCLLSLPVAASYVNPWDGGCVTIRHDESNVVHTLIPAS